MEQKPPELEDEKHQEHMAELEKALREADEAAKQTVEEFEAGDLPITADGELTPELLKAYAKFMRSQQPKSWYTKKRFRFHPVDYARRKTRDKSARRARKITRNAYRGR
jgi:uncharacterized protein YaiI (UPF0178 family)